MKLVVVVELVSLVCVIRDDGVLGDCWCVDVFDVEYAEVQSKIVFVW